MIIVLVWGELQFSMCPDSTFNVVIQIKIDRHSEQ